MLSPQLLRHLVDAHVEERLEDAQIANRSDDVNHQKATRLSPVVKQAVSRIFAGGHLISDEAAPNRRFDPIGHSSDTR
jgi:hypothetical protein